MILTTEQITENLKTLIHFFEPVHSLGNCHLGSFFTEHLWENEVPVNIQSELSNVNSVNDFIHLFPEIIRNNCPNDFSKNHPNLITFVEAALKMSVITEEKYLNLLLDLEKLSFTRGYSENNDLDLKEFMSAKKQHEVKITSKMTALISKITESSHIVDVGGGKGYLSSILALKYSFKVLGLDLSEVTTCGAVKRSQKVAKMWTGNVFKQSLDTKNTKKAREYFMQNHFKQCISFVKPDTDVEKFLKEGFNEEIASIMLVGLHTCGDLASTSLQMFVRNKKIRGILNVGCCYHLINEEYYTDNAEIKRENYGFPLSSFLRKEKYWLGRNARMLSAHSLYRISSNLDSEFSQTSVFFRAVLQTVIAEKLKETSKQGQVGRLAKKCSNFHEYMFTAFKKLGIDTEFTENDLNDLYERYISQKQLLTAFYLLRISLAPAVESIILLDRILYLIENGISNVYLVPLFNLVISPRGFGIIAWKDTHKCQSI